jgi:hypothetical protein
MRKRSKYKPKKVMLDVMSFVKSGLMRFDEVEGAVSRRLKTHLAMELLRLGRATKDEIQVLIAAYNMIEALSRLHRKFGQAWSKELRDAEEALLAVARRGVKTSHFVCKAAELTAMRLAIEIHDAQLDIATVKDLELAMGIVHKEFSNKRMRAIEEEEA